MITHRRLLFTWLVIIVMLGLLFTLANPLKWFMPTQFEMLVLAIFSAVFSVFIGLFWYEQSIDERDVMHTMSSGRVAYFVGTTLVAIAIIVQSLQHSLDAWLPIILGAMVLSKYVARQYANRYQ